MMMTAYTDAANRPTPDFLNLLGGSIAGSVLTPGLYKWESSVTVDTDITIKGAPDDTWIFQVTGDLTVAPAQKMTLTGGARAKNIVWQVAGTVAFQTGSHAEGVVLTKTAVAMGNMASINGRLLAQTMVALDQNAVINPVP